MCNSSLPQIDLASTIIVPISLDKVDDFFLAKRVSENRLPLLRPFLQIGTVTYRRAGPVPFPVQSAGSERRELRRFAKADGEDGGVGLGVGVPEIEGQVGLGGEGRDAC